MKQEQINYSDIIDAGFKVTECNDKNYFNDYGFPYKIITKKLMKFVYLEWTQETRFCKLVRVDKEGSIKGKLDIIDFDHMHEIINFFTHK